MNETEHQQEHQRIHTEALGRMAEMEAANRMTQLGLVTRAHLLTERLVRKTQNGTLGTATDEPEDDELGNMDLRVGDQSQTHHHYPAPPAAAAAPATTASTLAKLGLAAALGAGGVAGWPLLQQLLQPAAQQQSADTDTRYSLELSTEPPPAP